MEQEIEYQDDLEYSVAPFLFKDFLSRFWWVVLVILLIGFPRFNDDLIVNPVHVVIMMLMGPLIVAQDRKREVWPIYKVLPLSNHELSRILWLEGVAIFPLIYLVWNLTVLLFNLGLAEAQPSFNIANALIIVSALTFLEIGYSSLMMLFLPYLPYSENENFKTGHILAGVMWGLLIIVPIFSFGLFLHFKIIEQNKLWGSALLLTCPVLITLSYLLRGRLLKETPEKVTLYRWEEHHYSNSTISFWFQFWIQQSGVVIIGMICCFVLATIVNLILNHGEAKSGVLLIFTLFLLFVIPAFSVVWGDAIRALRTLPVTTRKLGYFLLLEPVRQRCS